MDCGPTPSPDPLIRHQVCAGVRDVNTPFHQKDERKGVNKRTDVTNGHRMGAASKAWADILAGRKEQRGPDVVVHQGIGEDDDIAFCLTKNEEPVCVFARL